ncbi:MAG: phage tail protein [Victivallaceae bacterium]|nr:phage tail protein [Victivallaceae bacterium]
MIRSRFDELGEYLKGKLAALRLQADNIDFCVEKIRPEEGGHQDDENGTYLCNLAYTGVIYIERLQYARLPMLLLYIRSWLDEFDDSRGAFKLPSPQFDLIKLDSLYYDVQVSIEFIDPVYIAEADGTDAADDVITWNGKSYAAKEFIYNVADSGDVAGAPTETEAVE